MLRRGSPALVALALLAGCHLPAARLPERRVDDPVTLPRRMVTISTGVSFDRALGQPRRLGPDDVMFEDLRWGITDRLQLQLPGILSYAFL